MSAIEAEKSSPQQIIQNVIELIDSERCQVLLGAKNTNVKQTPQAAARTVIDKELKTIDHLVEGIMAYCHEMRLSLFQRRYQLSVSARLPHQFIWCLLALAEPASDDKGSKESLELLANALDTYAIAHRLNLCRRRNQLNPINGIPSDIVMHLAEPAVQTIDDYKSRASFAIAFSSVSHRWRDIALRVSRLWSSFPLLPFELTNTFLRRSANVPLDIQYIDYPTALCNGRDIIKNLALLSEHSNRWRTCHINWVLLHEICPYIRSSAPNLEVVHLGLRQPAIDALGMHLFPGPLPRLRHLSLSSFYVPLGRHMFTNLTAFDLSNLYLPASMNVNDMLSLLSTSPYLEELRFDRVKSTRFQESVGQVGHPISLPCLRLLQLKQRAPLDSTIHAILASIAAPPSLMLDIAAQVKESLAEILPRPPGLLTNLPNLTGIQHLESRLSSNGSLLQLNGYDSPEPSGKKRFSFALDMRDPLPAILPTIHEHIPLLHLEKFSLSLGGTVASYMRKNDYSHYGVLKDFLAGQPGLVEISFEGCPNFITRILVVKKGVRHVCPALKKLSHPSAKNWTTGPWTQSRTPESYSWPSVPDSKPRFK